MLYKYAYGRVAQSGWRFLSLSLSQTNVHVCMYECKHGIPSAEEKSPITMTVWLKPAPIVVQLVSGFFLKLLSSRALPRDA